MKDLYYKMRAWLVVRKMEKNENSISDGSVQDVPVQDDSAMDQGENGFE